MNCVDLPNHAVFLTCRLHACLFLIGLYRARSAQIGTADHNLSKKQMCMWYKPSHSNSFQIIECWSCTPTSWPWLIKLAWFILVKISMIHSGCSRLSWVSSFYGIKCMLLSTPSTLYSMLTLHSLYHIPKMKHWDRNMMLSSFYT